MDDGLQHTTGCFIQTPPAQAGAAREEEEEFGALIFINPIGASVQAWGTILFRIVHARGVISNEGEGAQHCSITSITAVHRSFELRSSFSGAVVKRHACEARGIWVGPT